MITIEAYHPSVGFLHDFKPVATEEEAIELLNRYCEKHNVTVVESETVANGVYTLLSDGSDFTYKFDD